MKAKTHRYIISLIFLLILLSCISTITYANDKGGSSSINFLSMDRLSWQNYWRRTSIYRIRTRNSCAERCS